MLTHLQQFTAATHQLFQALPNQNEKLVSTCLLLPWDETNINNFMDSLKLKLKEFIHSITDSTEQHQTQKILKSRWLNIFQHWVLRFTETDNGESLFQSQESCLVFKVALFNSILSFYANHFPTGVLSDSQNTAIAQVYLCLVEEIPSIHAENKKYVLNHAGNDQIDVVKIKKIADLFNTIAHATSSQAIDPLTTCNKSGCSSRNNFFSN